MMPHVTILLFVLVPGSWAFLRPQDSETRHTKRLDGIWRFRTCPLVEPDLGFNEQWFNKDLDETKDALREVIDMPVPSSYNDVTQDGSIRDYVGWVWYQRYFFPPGTWQVGHRIFLRFDAAHYETRVWLNGQQVMQHIGGQMAFETELSQSLLNFTRENQITVAINSTLSENTVPQGDYRWREESEDYPKGHFQTSYRFDFFNYAGIHRGVYLYAVPDKVYINDINFITVDVAKDLTRAVVKYQVKYFVDSKVAADATVCRIELLDKSGMAIAEKMNCVGEITIENPKLWWPNLMHAEPGYLHTLRAWVHNTQAGEDVYRLKVGIRLVSWDAKGLKINHRPMYLRGFGCHEDYDIRGKGLDLVTLTKDFNLYKWMGANAIRTTHYPYSEEYMDFADSHGIAVIDECQAVGLTSFGNEVKEIHNQMIKELITRDKNRASVIMWSIANEPRSTLKSCESYFNDIVATAKKLDVTRPMTLVTMVPVSYDFSLKNIDIVGVNRYPAWYSDTGHTELIQRQLGAELKHRAEAGKPVYISEYGADTIAGFHQNPPVIFTEEYQVMSMLQFFKTFDEAHEGGYLIGEMIWNFADFNTEQKINRVNGNKKGIFTRQRQPKAAAHLLRRRYWQMARLEMEQYNITVTDPYMLSEEDAILTCPP